MVRKYKRKDVYLKWTEGNMSSALTSALNGHLSLRGAAVHFQVPFTTLQRRFKTARLNQGLRNDHGGIIHLETKSAGHPTIFSVEEEGELVKRLKSLCNRGFGLTPANVRRAVYTFAKLRNIDVPWSAEVKMAGKDWFTSFMNRHSDISLRKPEGLSKARAMGVNKESMNEFYSLLKQVIEEFNFEARPQNIYNADESGFPMCNKPSKVIGEKGKREIASMTNLERGENVTVIACCSASGAFIPPFVIFKGKRMRDEFKQGMPPGTPVVMSETGYINEDLFLVWLEHFNRHRSQGKCLLVLDGHASHHSIQCLDYCVRNGIELLCLPPHTTHVLQPLDRTVFKPLKVFYHQAATLFVHSNPFSSITKFVFGPIFKTAWSKCATVGNAVKGFECTGIYPFNPNQVPEYKFIPSCTFSSDLNSNINHDFDELSDSVENPGPSNSPTDEASASRNKNAPVACPTDVMHPSQRESCSDSTKPKPLPRPISETLSVILPSPNKNVLKKKIGLNRVQHSACHLTSPEHVEKAKMKRKLQFLKERSAPSNQLKSVGRPNSRRPRPNHPRTSRKKSLRDSSSSSSETSTDEENSACGFCMMLYLDPESFKKGDWICCEKCETWYHEVCVGAAGRKQFTCGKCV